MQGGHFNQGSYLTYRAIEQIVSAVSAMDYDIRVIPRDENNDRPIRRAWKRKELLHSASIAFLRAKNSQGCDVFFRPNTYE